MHLHNKNKLLALFGSGLLLGTTLGFAPALSASAAQSTKLVVIPLENQSYDDIVGSSQAPYINHLINQGTVFTQYSGVVSGSNPNYLAMTSGLTSALTPPSPNIFQAIDASSGLTWKEFMESMTGTCAAGNAGTVPGSTDTLYTTDHDPAWAYQANATCNKNDVPLTSSSLSNLPSFSYLVPNECDDMHTLVPAGQTCPAFFGANSGSSQISMGDNWLSTVVPMLLAQSNVTVLVTWDENDGLGGAGPFEHIVTLEVGAGVTVGGIDGNAYNHYSLEAGLYRYFGLGSAPNNGASALPLPIPAAGAPPYPGPSNAITVENSNPGTTAWLLGQQADGYNQQIDGYASATSVNLGQPISFYISVNTPQKFTMDFYRMGYYQGLGGRFMLDVPNLSGVVQPSCPIDGSTGLIACNWAASYQLTIPTTWVSGVYLVKLTNAAGWQSYIIFAVRDDARASQLVYQVAFNTYEAYNNFPNDVPPGSTTGLPLTGKGLYDFNSSSTLTSLGTQRAVKVSFDRPFSDDGGAGAFLNYEINDVAWLEQQGYDVSYSSDVDTDLSGSNLLNHHGFISAGHDEYWSMTMYNAAANARDSGVNLAFLGADDVSWQVRYAASASNVPDRILICYKSAALDPVQNNTVTVHFRDPQVNVPEQLLVGGTSSGEQLGASNATPVAYIVQNPSNWVYVNTGAFNGESIPNVVGYEIDAYNSTYPSPTAAAGTYQLLSNSPIVNTNNVTVFQNTTIYQAASGAWVFSGAAIEWGWSLFNFSFATGGQAHPNYSQPFIQIMTANVLNKFSAGTLPLPAAPTNLVATPSASAVNLSWTDNDATATYGLDRSTDPAFGTFTTVSLPAGTTSYNDSGLSAGVYYYRLVAIGPNGKSPYLSASAATISYAALVSGRPGVLAHWRLGESSGTTAYDTTGTYNGTYLNTPTLGQPGAIANDTNTSVTFNGSTQRVNLPTVPSVGDFSIEGWSFLTNGTVNNNTLYGGSGTARLMPRPGNGTYPLAAYAGVTLNGTEYYLQPTSPATNINTWVYWVLTRQGSLLTLYRNGVQIGQRSDLPATAAASINGYIAAQNNGAYYLAGGLQDVALYTQALSSTDVRNGYATGLNGVVPTPPPAIPTKFAAVPSSSAVTLTWTDGDSISSYSLARGTDPSFQNPVTISLPPGTSSYTDSGLGQGVFYYKLVATNLTGQSPAVFTSAATTSYTALVSGRSGLLGHWRLNEPSGTTAWDTTGANNGYYLNGPALGSPGGIANDPSTSVTFNGSSQRVNLPSLPSSQDFSIEGWTYLTNASINNNTLYGSASMQLLARPGTGSFPTAAYAAVTLNGTAYVLQPNSPASNINTWVYWVMTRQGGTLTLYRNGTQIAQRTDLPATATTSLSGYIADESNGAYYLTGRVQDVAVYNRALSGLEVTNSYTAGLNGAAPGAPPATTTPYYNAVRSEPSLLGYWRLDDASGSTARDVMGKYNGTYVNGVTRTAAGAPVNDPDTSASFNGTTQLVTLPALPAAGDFTIEGWANLSSATVANDTLYGGGSTVQLVARPGTGSNPTAAYAGVTLNGTAYVLQPNSPASNVNTWVYFVLTRQGATLTLYRNAVQLAQRTDLPASASANINGYIGDEIGGLYYLTGGIDEVAVYNSALTPQDITSHYQAAQSGPAPAPTAPPSVAVTQPSNGATYGANWAGSISGTAATNSGFALTAVSAAVQDTTSGKWWGGSAFDQSSQTFFPVTSGTSTWSMTFPASNLTSGHSYSVTAQARDYVGNTGTSAAVAFTEISTPPSVAVSYPTNGSTYGANWAGAISGTASSNSGFSLASVSVALQDATTGKWWSGSGFTQASQTFTPVTSGTSTWSLTFPAGNLTSGHNYTVTAQATDTLGNAGTGITLAFSDNTTAPSTGIACNAAACSSGSYNGSVSVTLAATDNSGTGISATYYTTDGSTPTTSSTPYTGAFTLTRTSTVQFFSIDNAGNVEPVKSRPITVTAILVSIAVTPASPSIPKGTLQPFTASGTYSDGSTQDVASSVAWASSNSTVATITAAGVATGTGQGTAQISATSGGVTGSTTLTVGPPVLVSVTVSPTNSSIAKGTSQPFTATGGYSDGSTQDLTSSATWASSNPTIATITAAGIATGAAQGTSQISATSGAVTGSTTLTVGPASLVSIAVTPANPSIAKGLTQQFAATGTFSDGSTQDLTSAVSWSSSATGVATITATGLASGVAQGSSQISASSGGVTGSTTLTVGPAVLVSIAVTPANGSIVINTSQQFTATATYSDGSTQDMTGSAAWTSSNTNVATITAGGLVSGVADGTSQISAATGGVTGSTMVTVAPATLVSIAVSPTNPSIPKGTSQSFSATGTYSDGSTKDLTSSVTWSSSNPAVATITAGGLASGAAQGTSQISATSAGVTGSTTLTVRAAVLVSIAVTPANPSIAKGLTQQFAATGTYSDASTQDLTNAVSWVSADPTVASISSGGLATGVAQGRSQISASSSGISGNTALTVGPAVLASIAVTPANPTIAKGTTQQFGATGTYSDGSTQDLTGAVTWASANSAVATITAAGLASGLSQGTSQISANSGTVTGSTTLTVTPPALTSIAVTPANPSIPKGSSQQFAATGTYSDGSTQDVTSSVSWLSSASTVATISAGGLATGVAPGTSQISASSGAVSGSATLTVGPAVLVSIAVTPANPTIAKGTTQQFSATGTYSDASTQDLTSSAIWASSNSAVAAINASGLASGATQGTSQISATSGSVTGATTLTVGPPALVSIGLTPANPSIAQGNTQQFSATGTYTDGSMVDVTSSVTWASSNTSVATVTAGGLASGVAQGSSQISATSGAVSASTTLTVGPATLVSIAVTPANPSIPKGLTQQFTATGTYTDGSTQNLTGTATWASSNTAVSTITPAGLASGAAPGTSQISATSGSVTGSTTLTVGPAALVSIAVTPSNPSIAKGTTQQFTATGSYTDTSTLDMTSSVSWASATTGVATITPGGLATGTAQGASQISATSGAVTGTTTLTVGPAVLVSIAVTPANPSIAKGTTQQFTATGTYSDSSTQNLTSSVSWASSNTSVATITSGGLATGVGQSTSEISATSGAVKGSTTLAVGPAVLVSIAVSPTNPSIAKGLTQQLTAKGTYSDASTQDLTTSATWTSANTTVATISASGLATGIAQGTSQISASTAGVTGATTLTVGPAALVWIAVTPANPTIPKGTKQQFTATGTYTDGSTLDLTKSSTWTSSNGPVASITTAGLATAKAQGTSTISATSGGAKGSTLLTVGPAALVSISVTPGNQTVKVGTTVQYKATGKYTDGSSVNLTSSVTWSSSDTTIATITSAGLATTLKAGTVTISATSGTIVGSTSLKAQ